MMERILVIGCPGAGKTTLARQMSEKLNLPLIHLDSLFWLTGWKERERDEFDRLLGEALEKPKWIIDGNYGRTLPLRLQYCDTVVFLDFPTGVCLWGVIRRVVTNWGRVRPDMGAGCPERLDWEFLRYVRDFNKTNREKLLSKIAAADPSVKVITLKSRREVRKFCNEIIL